MDDETRVRAYNALVLNAHFLAEEDQGDRRAAAIASMYMGLANNGGINSFLTCTPELGSTEVVNSLQAIGARPAAEQLEAVLQVLGEDLPAGSQDDRDEALHRLWTEEVDAQIEDLLSNEADRSIYRALEEHAEANADYYMSIEARFTTDNPKQSFLSRLLSKLFGK